MFLSYTDDMNLRTTFWLILLFPLAAVAEPNAIHTSPTVIKWRVGVRAKAAGAVVTKLTIAAPIPTEWPEQSVKILDRDLSSHVSSVTFRDLKPGARQMVANIARLPAGEEAHAILTFEITRRGNKLPPRPELFQFPKTPPRDVRVFLTPSPLVESTAPEIRTLAEKLGDSEEPVWQQARTLYDYVRENVEFRKDSPLTGAKAALADGYGDCEAFNAVFIALCRAKGIPARTVWVPGHCYPEFYVQDSRKNGYWIPVEGALGDWFGAPPQRLPILQKGENYKLPELSERTHYARITVRGFGGSPAVSAVLEPVQ